MKSNGVNVSLGTRVLALGLESSFKEIWLKDKSVSSLMFGVRFFSPIYVSFKTGMVFNSFRSYINNRKTSGYIGLGLYYPVFPFTDVFIDGTLIGVMKDAEVGVRIYF